MIENESFLEDPRPRRDFESLILMLLQFSCHDSNETQEVLEKNTTEERLNVRRTLNETVSHGVNNS
jgi:alkyl hydroperoxide reductase subunit AhpF